MEGAVVFRGQGVRTTTTPAKPSFPCLLHFSKRKVRNLPNSQLFFSHCQSIGGPYYHFFQACENRTWSEHRPDSSLTVSLEMSPLLSSLSIPLPLSGGFVMLNTSNVCYTGYRVLVAEGLNQPLLNVSHTILVKGRRFSFNALILFPRLS